MKRYTKALTIADYELKNMISEFIADEVKNMVDDVSPFTVLHKTKFYLAEMWHYTMEDEGINYILVVNENDKTYKEYVEPMDFLDELDDFIFEEFRKHWDNKFKTTQEFKIERIKEYKTRLLKIMENLAVIADNPEFLVITGSAEKDIDEYTIEFFIDTIEEIVDYMKKK